MKIDFTIPEERHRAFLSIRTQLIDLYSEDGNVNVDKLLNGMASNILEDNFFVNMLTHIMKVSSEDETIDLHRTLNHHIDNHKKLFLTELVPDIH